MFLNLKPPRGDDLGDPDEEEEESDKFLFLNLNEEDFGNPASWTFQQLSHHIPGKFVSSGHVALINVPSRLSYF